MIDPLITKNMFKSKRRIRLGIWGLGRSRDFFQTLEALQFDVVAGCDFNEKMRGHFLECNPGAAATHDAEVFLKGDFDAVLLATFCPNHGPDAVRCLEAGKHVLSEVTAFHTPAEGARLVDAVEKSGLVYNLAENCLFTAPNMYLKRRWDEGVFGHFMYGEYEYLHEFIALSYSYITGDPVQPGHALHNWRSWLNLHYYNTHSLGPVMHITNSRPVRVTSLPSDVSFPGMPRFPWQGQPLPSLIKMSNGGVVRNIMGQTGHDTHLHRLYGTLGGAEVEGARGLKLRLGGRGTSPMTEVRPDWEEHGDLARNLGHGGGDFWVCYYFARQILEGTPAPFDVYHAADCTLQGIQAYRSMTENGQPFDIPDLRDVSVRKKLATDHFAQPRWDASAGLFPKGADKKHLGHFNALMLELIDYSSRYRAWRQWDFLRADVINPRPLGHVASSLSDILPQYRTAITEARRLVSEYAGSLAATALTDTLDVVGDSRHVMSRSIAGELGSSQRAFQTLLRENRRKERREAVKTALATPFFRRWWIDSHSQDEFIPGPKLPEIKFRTRATVQEDENGVAFAYPVKMDNGRKNWLFFRTTFVVAVSGYWDLRIGHGAPATIYLNGRRKATSALAKNLAEADRLCLKIRLTKGENYEFVAAIAEGLDRSGNRVCLRLTPSNPQIPKIINT